VGGSGGVADRIDGFRRAGVIAAFAETAPTRVVRDGPPCGRGRRGELTDALLLKLRARGERNKPRGLNVLGFDRPLRTKDRGVRVTHPIPQGGNHMASAILLRRRLRSSAAAAVVALALVPHVAGAATSLEMTDGDIDGGGTTGQSVPAPTFPPAMPGADSAMWKPPTLQDCKSWRAAALGSMALVALVESYGIDSTDYKRSANAWQTLFNNQFCAYYWGDIMGELPLPYPDLE
jgi:hypothetical protein